MYPGITVIKRDGRREHLDISKIRKYTMASCEGLEGVDYSELELDAKLQFRDGITTEEIQQTLIKTAVDKIDVDRPNWNFVAARLFLYDLYHKVTGFTGYDSLKDYFQRGESAGRIIPGLKEKYDLDDLNSHINPKRDLQFTYLGIKTLYDRYIIKDRNNDPIELPQQLFMGVAMFLAQNETNPESIPESDRDKIDLNDVKAVRGYWAKKFYDVISKFEVMVATPTLSNARTTRHQLSSCYVGSMNDNIEGIFDDYKEMAMLSKFGGGIGWDVSRIRALGSFIDNHKNAAGGVIPWLKITNDIAIAVDQLGTRKGAIAVYLEPWHMDILDFLDLKKNSGEERRRAHDLFPAVWLNDLFMKRVQKDELWSLFDPYDVPELTEIYGEEFEKKYIEYENNPDIPKRRIKAKELWKKILLEYYETGNPFLCFKDNANRRNQNDHAGIIRSSNLCTEIFQNTEPNHYRVKVTFEDGSEEYFEEEEDVKVSLGEVEIEVKGKKITSLHFIGGKKVYMVEKVPFDGKTAVCNLASVNLSRVNTPEKIKEVVPVAIRMLDNVIDLNYYPVRKTKDTNLKNRAIGLGAMGEAELLATRQIFWGSDEHLHLIDEIFEGISYHAINASCDLAAEKGIYPEFKGSRWEKGLLPIDSASEEAKRLVERDLFSVMEYDWEELREKVKKGIRNGYLMAIAPTSSISILTGTTQAIEPVYKRKWFEENLSGLIPVVVPKLSAETYMFYTPAYELDQTVLVKAAAIRQKWIDQGQSLNIFITTDKASGRYLNEIYTLGWKLGLKSFYYLRSQSPEVKEDVMDRSVECFGCQ